MDGDQRRVIGIVDADLIGRKKHRFPNLACMKISSYHKAAGDDVRLITSYDNIGAFDVIYISKVFTDTQVPMEILANPRVIHGGTGFFYDKAERLPAIIEHSAPDYHLYDEWVAEKIKSGTPKKEFVYYTDYSIGFLTRGCFRQCPFCVNQNYTHCRIHSPVGEFYDPTRPKLCFLDDNFFACPQWRVIIDDVKSIGKPFQFKQGLDERLLTDERIMEIATWKYDGDFIFAFDNVADKPVIEGKLKRIYELIPSWKKHMKFYVFCGYDRNGLYDDNFYIQDIRDTFERIHILSRYSAVPYIMRFEKCYGSKWAGIYAAIAQWCNQPHIFKKFSFELFCKCKGMGSLYSTYKRDAEKYVAEGHKKGATWRYYDFLSENATDVVAQYGSFTPCAIAEYGYDIPNSETG